MRALLVNNLFGDEARGGAEAVAESEARALAAAGHQVAVLCCGRTDRRYYWRGLPVTAVRPPAGFPYMELGQHDRLERLRWHWRHLTDSAWPEKSMAAVRRFKPEVVHTHNLMGLGFGLPRLIQRAGIRHVHTLHDVQLLHPSGQLPAGNAVQLGLLSHLYAGLARRAFGSPDTVISPSAFLLGEHRRFGLFPDSEGVVLPNPISGLGERRSLPSELKFLFVGKLTEHKGIRLLLKAWDGWIGARLARLEIIGDGPLADWVQDRTERLENVTWHGWLNPDELGQAWHQATYVVLPSTVLENAPTVISEAFAYGTPAVAADTGGVRELVREGETGFLFVPGDHCALRDALNRALMAWQSAEGRWEEMSANCRQWADEQSVARHVARLVSLYLGK